MFGVVCYCLHTRRLNQKLQYMFVSASNIAQKSTVASTLYSFCAQLEIIVVQDTTFHWGMSSNTRCACEMLWDLVETEESQAQLPYTSTFSVRGCFLAEEMGKQIHACIIKIGFE